MARVKLTEDLGAVGVDGVRHTAERRDDGKVRGTLQTAATNEAEVTRLMIGRSLDHYFDKRRPQRWAGALSLGRKRPRRARQWIAHFNRRQNYAYGGLDYTLE
jgi:hypothetical protein